MTTNLDISNVISVSVSLSAQPLSAFNTSNLLLLTGETPTGSFPGAGYQLYLSSDQVGLDFGTSSVTYQMAVEVFAQQPNILGPGGYLVIATAFASSETMATAITRVKGLVSFYGVMSYQVETQVHMLAAAAVIQANNMLGFFVQRLAADVAVAGSLDLLRSGSLTKSRGLFYDVGTDTPALLYQAAYAGRALSTNFDGSNTTQTMHLKPLAGVQPDGLIDQATLVLAQAAGADCYVSIQGVPVAFTSGANRFFDQVYNLGWLVGAIQVAGFNYLSGADTKVPQTEAGMAGLAGAYRNVCEQALTNAYAAPGTWTSATVFGNPQDLIANVAQRGYYIYTQPIAQQSVAARNLRQAPICQIALKEAGAMHSSAVIVTVNA